MDEKMRKRALESFRAAPDLLENALKSVDQKIRLWAPAPGEWNIDQVIFHIADSEANYYVRFRKAIAESGGAVVAFDQNKWNDTLAYPGRNTDEALQLFRALRSSSYRLLSQLAEQTWTNTVQHSERGTLTLENLFTVAENHVTEHLEQIKGNVTQFKAKGKNRD
jgi:hypothetical protein